MAFDAEAAEAEAVRPGDVVRVEDWPATARKRYLVRACDGERVDTFEIESWVDGRPVVGRMRTFFASHVRLVRRAAA